MLHTLSYEFEVPQNRMLQLKLPDTIKLGNHQIVLVIDEKDDKTDDFQTLFAETKGLWQQGDGLAYQQALRNEWQ